MVRTCILLLVLGAVMVGCKSGGTPTRGTPDATGTAPAPGPSDAPPTRPAPEPAPPTGTTADDGAGGAARPGACLKDQDCAPGNVCEECGEEKCCTPGCRSDAQCPPGRRCVQVQCIRAPCPALCE